MKEMTSVNRRLAAFAFADVAGFSAAVEANEAQTLALWRSLRNEILSPAIERHHGAIRRVIGDALFIEFRSAVEAVAWATEAQATLSELGNADAEALKMRIGINVDDAVVEEGDLHGNGINVAARIQALAEPGQILVTAAVYEYARNRIDVVWVGYGERTLKNIKEPVQIYSVSLQEVAAAATSAQALTFSHAFAYRTSTGPGVAVLPFRNLSGDPRENYFGEGITEDIISGLARNRALIVIARHSTLSYRDRNVDARQIARELGVRYLVGGSVRRHAAELRINADLNDATENRILWSDHFDGKEEELFAFQDRIATSVVTTIDPRIVDAEARRVRRKPTVKLDAYDCVLKAFSLLYALDDKTFFKAGKFLDRAIDLDASYAQAFAHKAWWYVLQIGDSKRANRRRDSGLAMACANRAMDLDPDDAFVLAVAGHVTCFLHGRPQDARELFDRALHLNPNSAFAWGVSASTLSFLGEADEALRRLGESERRSPQDPMAFFLLTVRALALFVAGRYDEAVDVLQKVHRMKPGFVAALRLLSTCLALTHREEEARAAGHKLLKLDPKFSITEFISWYPLQREADRNSLELGLREAGLPS